jgi:hypothetical protein
MSYRDSHILCDSNITPIFAVRTRHTPRSNITPQHPQSPFYLPSTTLLLIILHPILPNRHSTMATPPSDSHHNTIASPPPARSDYTEHYIPGPRLPPRECGVDGRGVQGGADIVHEGVGVDSFPATKRKKKGLRCVVM